VTLLVTGAGGLVGSAVSALPGTRGLPRADLDICDDDAVERILDALRPAAVLNAAAQANVDRADREPQRTWQVNAEAPGRLAAACAARGIRFVHLSTDYVLTGPEAPGALLHEDDRPDPRSTYGRSKRAGELAALPHGAVVVRVQWLYGLDGPGFFARAMRALRAGEPLRLVTDQVGRPTPVDWLARRLLACAAGGPTGLFHLAPLGEASAWDWITMGAAALGVSTTSAAPVTRAALGGAFRPARSCLDPSRFQATWPGPLPAWDAALRDIIDRAVSRRSD
jgi:dTDP-4-dehydrorhamnose reductase